MKKQNPSGQYRLWSRFPTGLVVIPVTLAAGGVFSGVCFPPPAFLETNKLKDMNDYEKDMYINEDSLEIECLDQAVLMVKYTTQLAEAKKDRDQSKERLDVLYADLDLKIREDPEQFKLSKITEGAVRSAILMNEDYQKAQNKLDWANYEVNVLQGVVSAIDQRKSMIEGLIRLHGQQYFAGPNVPHNMSELRKKSEERINKGINQKLKRTRNG